MSRRVEDKLQADSQTTAAIYHRPARKQPARPAHEHDGGAGGGSNIWYNDKRRRGTARGVRAATRCVISRDAGRTRADAAGVQQFCMYFAQGCCTAGQLCQYLHRAPTEQDAVTLAQDHSRDCFGRDRARHHKDDRKGVGSALRDCRTLFVYYGGAGGLSASEVHRLASENFGEWGRLRKVYVVPAKTLVFVEYEARCNAEFAKEAMQSQGLKGSGAGEVLEIRWANDDPNPSVVQQVKRTREEMFVRAVEDEVARLPDDRKQARVLQMSLAVTGAYPDTDAQYNLSTLPTGGPSAVAPLEYEPPVVEDDISRYITDDPAYYENYEGEETGEAQQQAVENVAAFEQGTTTDNSTPTASALGLLAGYCSGGD